MVFSAKMLKAAAAGAALAHSANGNRGLRGSVQNTNIGTDASRQPMDWNADQQKVWDRLDSLPNTIDLTPHESPEDINATPLPLDASAHDDRLTQVDTTVTNTSDSTTDSGLPETGSENLILLEGATMIPNEFAVKPEGTRKKHNAAHYDAEGNRLYDLRVFGTSCGSSDCSPEPATVYKYKSGHWDAK